MGVGRVCSCQGEEWGEVGRGQWCRIEVVDKGWCLRMCSIHEIQYYICRIIIVVDLTVLMSGTDVGGVIGKPSMLDIVRVDQSKPVPMTTNSGRGFQGKVNQFNGGPSPQQSRPGKALGHYSCMLLSIARANRLLQKEGIHCQFSSTVEWCVFTLW